MPGRLWFFFRTPGPYHDTSSSIDGRRFEKTDRCNNQCVHCDCGASRGSLSCTVGCAYVDYVDD